MIVFSLFILIILEVALTVFLVNVIENARKKVEVYHEKFILFSTELLIINDRIKETVKKTNKVLRFITNKRFYQTISILKAAFNTVQIILLLRSFDFSKGKLLNYKNVKKLLVSEVIRRFLRKIILNAANLV